MRSGTKPPSMEVDEKEMIQKKQYTNRSDEWSTPQDVFDELNAEFHFDLDPCATDENHKCENYFTKEQDGLKQNWGGVQSVLQSTIRKYCKVDGEVFQRGVQRQYIGCHAYTIEDRHKIFPQFRLQQSRDTFHKGKIAVWR